MLTPSAFSSQREWEFAYAWLVEQDNATEQVSFNVYCTVLLCTLYTEKSLELNRL